MKKSAIDLLCTEVTDEKYHKTQKRNDETDIRDHREGYFNFMRGWLMLGAQILGKITSLVKLVSKFVHTGTIIVTLTTGKEPGHLSE